MAYRKVEQRIWPDERFCELSERGKLLFLWFLTGPYTTPLPGLVAIGRAGAAEALGWLPETLPPTLLDEVSEQGSQQPLLEPFLKPFLKVFAELESHQMARADWEARLVWLPNGFKHNPPANANVLKSWRGFWDMLPECPMKGEALQALADALTELPKLKRCFEQVFPKHLSETPSARVSRTPSRNTFAPQEQEQEQEERELLPIIPDQNHREAHAEKESALTSSPAISAAAARIVKEYQAKVAPPYGITGGSAAVQALLEAGRTEQDLQAAIQHYATRNEQAHTEPRFRMKAATFFTEAFSEFIDGIPDAGDEEAAERERKVWEQMCERDPSLRALKGGR